MAAQRLIVKLLSPTAALPTKANPSDAGIDIRADVEHIVLAPGASCLIPTGIAICPPPNTYGQVFGRSGLFAKNIFASCGVIDPGYTGEIKIHLLNASKEMFEIKRGARIAQIVFLPFTQIDHIVELRGEEGGLGATDRGSNGFGSSGMN